MHNLLKKLLKKRNVELDQLTNEEKEQFDNWQKILSEGEITVDKILEFCQSQINVIESQWKNLDNSEKKNERLILLHNVYKSLVDLIKSPKVEKENLERYLSQLLK